MDKVRKMKLGGKIIGETEKAIKITVDLKPYGIMKKYVPKSIVKNNIVPSWFFEKNTGLEIEVELKKEK